MRPNPKSHSYQHLFAEVFVDQKDYESYLEEESESQEYLELKDELLQRYKELITAHCDPIVIDMIAGLAAGKTQLDVAKELGYKTNGSVYKRVFEHPQMIELRRIAASDPQIKAIKAAMEDL